MIWFSLIIPLLAMPLSCLLWPRRIVWWEVFFPLLPPMFIIPLCLVGGRRWATADYERWGNYAVRVEYYEFWDEEVPCRHPIYEDMPTGQDSDGNVIYTSVYVGDEHFYDVDDHAPFWQLQDDAGYWHKIGQQKYTEIARKWGGETFHDMHRSYHSRDGDMYFSTYPDNDDKMVFVFTDHVFENRVQVNQGVFAYDKIIDPSHLYRYEPVKDMFNDPAILGDDTKLNSADWKLQQFNAKFGRSLQIRLWVLLFKDEPRRTGFEQESYWLGGNKNELVVTIGTDAEGKVQWCHPFCWSPDGYAGNDELRIRIRDFVEKQEQLDLEAVADFMITEVPTKWKRKSFEELNFLEIPMPLAATWIAFVLVALATAGCILLAVKNDVNVAGSHSRYG